MKTSFVPLLALALLGGSPARQNMSGMSQEPQMIYQVDAVTLGRLPDGGLVILAAGTVNTGGWSHGILSPTLPPTVPDSAIHFIFMATPPRPGTENAQVLTPISAGWLEDSVPGWIAKVSVAAAQGAVTVRVSDAIPIGRLR